MKIIIKKKDKKEFFEQVIYAIFFFNFIIFNKNTYFLNRLKIEVNKFIILLSINILEVALELAKKIE